MHRGRTYSLAWFKIGHIIFTNFETIIIHVGAMARRHGAGLKSELCSALPRP